MTPATHRGALFSVTAAAVLLFAVTTMLTSAFRSTRQSRADARYQAGLQLAAAGKNAEAAEEFRAALTYEHSDARYRLALSRSLIESGRWGEASSYLSELAEDDPTSGPINLMLARIATRDHREQEAVTYYQRAVYGLWPDRPAANRTATRFELVALLERTGQQKQVLAELLDLADETPESDLDSRRKNAEMLLAHGSPDHAVELYRGILAAVPHDAAAEKGLADGLFALGDYAGARRAYREAITRGLADPSLGQRIAACDAVIDLDPTLVHLSAGQRFARAQELVRRTLQVAQGCSGISADLTGAAEKAVEERAARRRDGDTVAMLTLAEQLWAARQQTCGPARNSEPALAAVMAKLQKQ